MFTCCRRRTVFARSGLGRPDFGNDRDVGAAHDYMSAAMMSSFRDGHGRAGR
jgi:hypothetical protein